MNNSAIYAEINIICTLVLTLLCVKVIRSLFIQEQKRIFLKVTISNITFLIMDLLWTLLNNNSALQSTSLIWLFDAGYFALAGLVGWYWFLYSETVQESKFATSFRYRNIAKIPVFILLTLLVISHKTDWIFFIDSTNHFHRGPAYALDLIISYGYVLFTAIKAFRLSHRTHDYHDKVKLETLAKYIIPTVIAGTLQIYLSKYPIICVGNTLGILYIYITLLEQMISLDPLTKLNNRNQMYQLLSNIFSHPNQESSLYLLIMDVDYFKSINDNYGHVEGDIALKRVADSLLKVFNKPTDFVCRYGGDEFVVLSEITDENALQYIYNYIQKTLEEYHTPYSLTLSIGSAKYSPEIKDKLDFINSADKELYKVKKMRKSRIA